MKNGLRFLRGSYWREIICIVIVVLGYGIGIIEKFITPTALAFALGFVVISLIAFIVLFRILGISELGQLTKNLNRSSNKLEEIIRKKVVEDVMEYGKGVVTDDELKIIEASANKEIWIMSPSLRLDSEDLKEVVEHNLLGLQLKDDGVSG